MMIFGGFYHQRFRVKSISTIISMQNIYQNTFLCQYNSSVLSFYRFLISSSNGGEYQISCFLALCLTYFHFLDAFSCHLRQLSRRQSRSHSTHARFGRQQSSYRATGKSLPAKVNGSSVYDTVPGSMKFGIHHHLDEQIKK